MRSVPGKAVLAVLAGLVAVGLCDVARAALTPPYHVSQKGRTFQPGELTVSQGDVVQLVNDDGDLLHHAYIDSSDFSFDSGDQEPGGKTDIHFTVAGTFTVLCGIHPKMKLVVHVN
jgi:plastocyanin